MKLNNLEAGLFSVRNAQRDFSHLTMALAKNWHELEAATDEYNFLYFNLNGTIESFRKIQNPATDDLESAKETSAEIAAMTARLAEVKQQMEAATAEKLLLDAIDREFTVFLSRNSIAVN